ncbi:MAG: FAD-dependent oxidoreductase [Paracoccaceae bacterium]
MGPRVTIIGASLAGLRSAEAVLAALPQARITLIGAEPHLPYNRPPLSKDGLSALVAAGGDPTDMKAVFCGLTLRHRLPEGAVDWRLGLRATAVDAARQHVLLSDGTTLGHDWLIAATGLRPRRLPFEGADDRRHVLRSFDDATRLAAALRPGVKLAIIGAGLIGCEMAGTTAALGCKVTLIEPQCQPMLAVLGPRVAAAMAQLHRARGVDLRCGLSVAGLLPDGLRLSDDSRVEADVILESAGSLPNVDWLSGTGIDLSDGILCDNTLSAIGNDRILAVGDVARFPNPLFGGSPRRVEHWGMAGLTARRAAETIAAREAGRAPGTTFAPLPGFWSDQHGLRLQGFGIPTIADETRLIEGDLAMPGTTPCIVEYRRDGRAVAVLGIAAPPAAMAAHRARLERALSETVPA